MQSKLLAEEISKAIDKIDPELDYREFADAVAIVIKEEYSNLNQDFVRILKEYLNEVD